MVPLPMASSIASVASETSINSWNWIGELPPDRIASRVAAISRSCPLSRLALARLLFPFDASSRTEKSLIRRDLAFAEHFELFFRNGPVTIRKIGKIGDGAILKSESRDDIVAVVASAVR